MTETSKPRRIRVRKAEEGPRQPGPLRSSRRPPGARRWRNGCLIACVLLLVLAIITAPAFHWLWFGLLWRHMTGSVLILVCMVIAVRAIVRGGWKARLRILSALLPLLVFLILYARIADGLAHWYLVRDVQANALDALPETSEVRYLPLEVAERYARNKIQDSRYEVGDIDPQDVGGELDWVAPRVPTGLWNRLFSQADGFMVVKPDGQVETVHQAMTYGEGMGITTHITWPLWKRRYAVDLPEFYYFSYKGQVLAIAPYVSYRYVFPVQVPYWGGVFVIHSDGQIEDLSPQQAMADARLSGQWLYPEALARAIGDAWGYRGGVLNAWFSHRDQGELPSMSSWSNQMPYLLPTPDGPQWFIGLEPYGPSYSIFKMLFVDARSGLVQIKELPQDAGLIGPVAALGYVRSAFPTYNWYSRGEKESSGDVLAVEPRPIIKDGTLHWQSSVTNTAYAGVRRTALVNAYTSEVIYFESLDEMRAFLAGSFTGHGPAAVAGGPDLGKMSDAELLQFLRRITDELERRRK